MDGAPDEAPAELHERLPGAEGAGAADLGARLRAPAACDLLADCATWTGASCGKRTDQGCGWPVQGHAYIEGSGCRLTSILVTGCCLGPVVPGISVPQLTDEPVGRGALQQGLFDLRELDVRQPGRRAAGTAAPQRVGAAGLPAGIPQAHGLASPAARRPRPGARRRGNSSAARNRRASSRSRSCCAAGRRGMVGMPDPHPPSSTTPTRPPSSRYPRPFCGAVRCRPGAGHEGRSCLVRLSSCRPGG
jgi:hypothetical protein